jgi:5-methylcytosine-specific restriction endonuclease McrA
MMVIQSNDRATAAYPTMPSRPATHKQPRLTKRHQVATGEDWRAGKTSAQRGYGYKWQQARSGYLKKHPLCVQCEARNRLVLASVVDHIADHKGDKQLFWDSDNWQALCVLCHNSKTASTQVKRA